MREVRRNMLTFAAIVRGFLLPNFRHGSGACGAKSGMRLAFDNCVKAAPNTLVPVWRHEYIGAQNGLFGVSRMNDLVTADYVPTDDEPFMNERQKAYFRAKLIVWKNDILREARETLEILQQENANHPDLADRASSETDRAIELRARDRQRKLIAKIDSALQRIEEGTYGYCEETGEPIALKRLDARPIATLSIEAQERHERREKVYRDD
jgi:DnaK suppressor protein